MANPDQRKVYNQDFGLGIGYERILGKNHKWGLYLPLTLGLSHENDYRAFFGMGSNSNKAAYYQSYSFAPGIKWYAGLKTGKVKYSVGPHPYLLKKGQRPISI